MRSTILVALALGFMVSSANAQDSFTPLRYDGNGIPALGARIRSVLLLSRTRGESLRAIAQTNGVNITFDETLPSLQKEITVRLIGPTVASALLSVVQGAQVAMLVNGAGQVVVVPVKPNQPNGVVRGFVRDASTGDPIEYARISLSGSDASAMTRADGSFQVSNVRPDAYGLRVTRIGFRPESVTVQAGAEQSPVSVALDRAPVPLADMRIAPTYGLMQQDIAAPQTLTKEEIRTNPQVGEDIFRAVNRLPGLASNDMSARFYARGGSQDELYVTLDGLELYEPFHLKDIDAALSIIDVEAIRGVDVSTGGFTADYGNRLTGVFNMRSADARTDRARTSLGLSVTNLRGGSQGGFADGKGAWLVSLRRGYLDLALKLTNAGDSISPTYYDAFAKVQYDISTKQKLGVHLLQAGDRLNYLDNNEPSIDSNYESTYGWVTLEGALTDRISHSAVASVSRLTWNRRGIQSDKGVRTFLVDDARSFNAGSIKEDLSLSASDRALFRFGGEVKHLSADYDYLRWWRTQSSNAQGQTVLAYDTTAAGLKPAGNSVSAYLTTRLKLASSLVTELGGRFDGKTYGFSEKVWSPRVNIAWTPVPRTTFRAAYGKYFQFEPIYGVPVQDGVAAFDFAEQAIHSVLSVEQQLARGTTLRIEGYDRALRHVRPSFVNALNEVNAFPEATLDRQLVAPEEANARGIEFFLKHSGVSRADFSASYAFGRIEDKVLGQWIPRAADQRHTVYVDAALHSDKWRLSAGALYHSGSPYTPAYFIFDTLPATNGNKVIRISQHLGARNSGRLPAYYRFDFRATRYFTIGTSQLMLFADLFNAFNRRNARGYEYNFRGTPLHVERAPDGQVPRLPTLGLTWEF